MARAARRRLTLLPFTLLSLALLCLILVSFTLLRLTPTASHTVVSHTAASHTADSHLLLPPASFVYYLPCTMSTSKVSPPLRQEAEAGTNQASPPLRLALPLPLSIVTLLL